jgi:hypothetical protein
LRKGRASIVQRLAGGRSVGALPIALDFPTPPTVSYGFVRPFLGRTRAELRVRPISRSTAMLAELALAAAAAALLAAARSRSHTTGLAAEGGVLTVSAAVLAAVPAPGGSLFGATALVAAAFLGAEAISTTAKRMRRLWAQESIA